MKPLLEIDTSSELQSRMRPFLVIALLFLLIVLAFSPVWKSRLFDGDQVFTNTR